LAKSDALLQGASQASGLAPELEEIVTAWHVLAQPLKMAVLAIVRSAKGQS
jgi:phosphodiesterase/alkaline phosphatase D-like protein